MSRAYRVAVNESLTQVVHLEDGVATCLELLPVLDRQRTADLVAIELEKRGFRREGGSMIRDEDDGIRVAVELETGEVTVKIAGEKQIQLEMERSTSVGAGQQEKAEEKLRADVKKALGTLADEEREQARKELTKKLEAKLGDLRAELDAVANRVTAEALKVKAGQLGTIESIAENPTTGELTIKVRV